MTARRPSARRARLIVALVALTVLAVIAVPTAAWANHTVTWGVGAPDGPRQAEVDGPTDFGVSVSLDGQPLAGWPMLARVSRDGETTEEIEFATDGSGLGAFTVDTVPGADEDVVVTICDDDGCVYGETILVGVPPPSPDPEPSPTATPTEASTPTTAPTEASTPAAVATAAAAVDGSASSAPSTWVLLVAIGLALMLLGGLLFGPRLAGGPGTGAGGTRPRPARGGGRTRPRGGDDEGEPRDAPPSEIAGGTQPREAPSYCDWAAYYLAGGKRIKVRTPTGRECCSYEIRIHTTATRFHDHGTTDEKVHHVPQTAGYDQAHRKVAEKFAGDAAGVGASLSSSATWVPDNSVKGPPHVVASLPPVELSGDIVTEVELRILRQPHCLGNDAHEFETESIASSGSTSVNVSCKERTAMPSAGCANSFKATFLELAAAVDGTDFTRYELHKSSDWSTTEVKGSKWTVTTGKPELSAGATLSKEVKTSAGPVDLTGKIGTGVSVAYDPGDSHNPPRAATPLTGGPGTAGTGTHSSTYELTFGHTIRLKVEHNQKEMDLTGSWDDYASTISAGVDVDHDAVAVGKITNQWQLNHAQRPSCCVEGGQPCLCKPALRLVLRGRDTRQIPGTGGAVVPAQSWQIGGRAIADAHLHVDGQIIPLQRARSPRPGRLDWAIHGSWKPKGAGAARVRRGRRGGAGVR